MEFRLLGPLEVVTDDGTVEIGSGKRRALLAHLLIHANEVVSAERLMDELWDERPPATAAKSVQVYVSQLRKALSGNGNVLVTRGTGYVLQVQPGQLDAQIFEALLVSAQRALADGDVGTAAGESQRALDLWRGPALDDVAYEAFAQREAARLEELRLVAIETRIEAQLALGDHLRVASELEALVAGHPLHESFRAQLMVALYRCGRQSEALDAYRAGSRLLREQLGIEPSPELRELEQKILTHDDELAAPRHRWRLPAARRAPAPTETESRRRRAPWLVVGGAIVLLAAAALAVDGRSGNDGTARVALDAAPNSMVVVDPVRARAVAALPLLGRPTDVATDHGRLWVTTVASPSLMSIDARTRKILRTIPLRGRPDAVVFAGGSVWVADGSSGVLAQVRPGYGTVLRQIRFPRVGTAPASAERLHASLVSLAATPGVVWLANRSHAIFRVDAATGRTQRVAAGARVDAVTSGAGAVWALAPETASVLRVDPARGHITDRVAIVARQGPELPAPTAIAAGSNAVWVLNGNSATVTRINPQTRAVEMTAELGIDRLPADIAASGDSAWVANFDGSLAHLRGRSATAKSVWVGGSLERVAATRSAVWATTTVLDQKLPGGSK